MLNQNEFSSLYELLNYFQDEKACHQYLAEKRWGGYLTCPFENCEGDSAYVFKDGIRYKCKCCRKIYTAKSRTIFECSNLPLRKWFIAMYLLLNDKGISSIQFAKNYNITQKSAWFLLHRIRTVLVNINQDELLSGVVEIDEAYIGGKNKNRHHDKKTKFVKENIDRHFKDKVTVLGMMQRGKGIVRLATVDNRKKRTLKNRIRENVKLGSKIMTDEWRGYNGVILDYEREIVNHTAKQYVQGDCHTNTLEGFWTQMKRLIGGRHHWVSKKHVNLYMQESAYRYNSRNNTVSYRFKSFIEGCKNVILRLKNLIKKE